MAQEIKAKDESSTTEKTTPADSIKTAEKKVETAKTTEKKTEVKAEKKEEAKKVAPVKKKFIPYVKKANKAKSNEARENMKKLSERKLTPVFRGRFGKKNIRRKSIAKWDKWRKPHGIDLDKGLQHGFRPKIGYRSRTDLRGIHPSGYMEVMVCNINDLGKVNSKIEAARFSRTLGKRKRNELIKKANELGIWVLN
ncbi:MAG: eL32 family ribosomal protein [archaeon]